MTGNQHVALMSSSEDLLIAPGNTQLDCADLTEHAHMPYNCTVAERLLEAGAISRSSELDMRATC
jgi:hypothetical protein